MKNPNAINKTQEEVKNARIDGKLLREVLENKGKQLSRKQNRVNLGLSGNRTQGLRNERHAGTLPMGHGGSFFLYGIY